MPNQICPKCQRSVEPLETLKHDKNAKQSWLILSCPNERCNFNIDLREITIKLWNERSKYFEAL